MIFDNPIFRNWYTDTVDIYRAESVEEGSVSRQERKKINTAPVPCRIYSTEKGGPNITGNAARERSLEKLACDLSVDIRAGDELRIVRGGNLGHTNREERFLAGDPADYYDPVGGISTGLQHKEIGLLKDNLIGR